MKKGHCILLLLVLAACVLNAQPFDLMEQLPSGPLIRGGFQNDSFGLLPGVEWDDNESYVFRAHAVLGSGLYFSSSLHSFTARTADPATGSRIDMLKLGGAYWLRPFPLGFFEADGGVYIGLSMLGNLGSGYLQSSWHDGVGVSREVPESYDTLNVSYPETAAFFRLALEGILVPFIACELGAGYREFSARALAGLRFEELSIAVGGQVYTGFSGSFAYDSARDKESGLVFAAMCNVGVLTYKLELLPYNDISTASVFLTMDNRAAPSAFGLDFGILLGSSSSTSVQISRIVPMDISDALLICAGASVGWVDAELMGIAAPRAIQYRIGAAWESPSVFHLLRARIGLHGLMGMEELRTISPEESTVLDDRILIGAGGSAEFRLYALPFLSASTGIGVRAWYFPFKHYLINAETDFRGRPPALFEVFVFSGGADRH